MKLILWLLISLFHLIYGNEEPPTTIIDTVELKEEHQKIVKWINETKMRNIVKKSLWEKPEKDALLKVKDEILKVKDEILKEKDEILKEKDAKLNNSVYTFVNCAMSQILSMLEIGYQINATNSNVTPSNEDAYKICKRLLGYKDTDLHILIEREAHWTEKFDNRSYRKIPHEEVYVKEVLRYKDVWLKYLHSDEGRKLLVTLIGNESFDIKDQCPLLVRFSYNIARLYKIAYICCHKLLEELRKMILADPKKTFMNHLRDLVRKWSCTAEQIYFYNKFVKFMFPENPESYYLTAYKFGKVKINQEREVTFVVPYTTENCGLQGSEETLTLLDTY